MAPVLGQKGSESVLSWAALPQVITADGSWQQLQVPEGHIAVLAGYTLEQATCGLVKAVTHRVVRCAQPASC